MISIDLAGSYQVVERLVRVFGDDVVNFGGIGLEVKWSAEAQRAVRGVPLTIFLFTLRILL